MKERPLIGVGVIVIKEGEILFGKRRNAHGDGCWSFPGGHLEYGEEIEACARREVLEETGLTISNIRRGAFTNDVFAKEEKHYVTLFMIADYKSGTLEVREPEKCEKWEWRVPQSLPSPLFLPILNLIKGGFNFASIGSP